MSGWRRAGRVVLKSMVLMAPLVAVAQAEVLYDQRGACTDHAANSQQYDQTFATYTDFAADDFVVPAGETWNIGVVDAGGVYYNGPFQAPTVNVFFYADNSGVPGAPICGYKGITTFVDASGVFTITLPGACSLTATTATTYWVSVQAQLDYLGSMSQWGWNGNTPQAGNPAKWQNPGGAFGMCPTWDDTAACVFNSGPDFCFALSTAAPPDDLIFKNGFD